MKMKTRIIFLILLVCAGALLARSIAYNHSTPPRLPLGPAYDIAMTTLGETTNEFHCVAASLAISFSPDGEWFFTFCSTNGTEKYVTVFFDGKTTRIDDNLPPR
jgi:hypothetical protein